MAESPHRTEFLTGTNDPIVELRLPEWVEGTNDPIFDEFLSAAFDLNERSEDGISKRELHRSQAALRRLGGRAIKALHQIHTIGLELTTLRFQSPETAEDTSHSNDAAATGEPTRPADPLNKAAKGKWLADALLLRRDHPDWSDAKIARRVHVHKSTLSRSPEYQYAKRLSCGDEPIQGHVCVDPDTGSQSVEAYSEDDPAELDWDETEP